MGEHSRPMSHPASRPLSTPGSNSLSQLPPPEPDALDASLALLGHIERAIDAADGWIGFADYMQLALYAPGLGYYAGGARKFGPDGDFVTAPTLGPLFARTLAAQVAEIVPHSAPEILEFGAGGGELAGDLLGELAQRGCAIERYAILEPGAELSRRQRAAISQRAPQCADRVVWLERLPEHFSGVMIANEVVDAMPVALAAWREEGLFERGVTRSAKGLSWSERPAVGELFDVAQLLDVAPPYESEIALAAPGWIRTLAKTLSKGALLVIDYGFPAREFYHPQRSTGTLMCHYRHHAHTDPFFLPGLQDITAHVDFSALARAGTAAGLDVLGYATQANFLVNCGITGLLAHADPADVRRYAPLAACAHKLLSPAEMGELFKVLCLGRGVPAGLSGFARGDRSHTL